MKKSCFVLSLLLLCSGSITPTTIQAQGTLVYDQQSANESTSGGLTLVIQANQPIGQSFTPSLTSVGFVRLAMGDANFNNGIGATVYVNLRENSLTGNILSSTDPVFMADRFGGYQTFFFQSPVSVNPGTTYFFQPVVQSGDSWGIVYYNAYNYQGGSAYSQGASINGYDLWFREGIIVPEPSAAALLGVASLLGWRARPRRC